MRPIVMTLLLGAATLSAETINFDSSAAGSAPAGWSLALTLALTLAMTHDGGAPKWETLKDPTAPSSPNVLAQTSNDPTNGRFPLAILDAVTTASGKVSVKFRPISGEVDQAGGLVWRYKDKNNYYVVRANALENNVVLYKVEGGKRSSLAPKGAAAKTYGVKHRVPSGTWSTLGVAFDGSLFTVYFDGKKLYEVEDNTFGEAGKVGIWTKADSVTNFDDFQVSVK